MVEFDLGQVVGADGKGIVSIELISTSGKNKTYRITFTDETYFDYTVKDGDDAISAIVTAWEQTLSDSKVPSEKLTKDTLDTKVDKVTGKGLSTEDYTTVEKSKLAGIEAEANKTVVDSSLSSTSENPVQNQVVKGALDLKADTSSLSTVATTGDYDDLLDKPNLATVATTGDYDDLTDKPSIPTKTSDLTNDSDFVESTDLSTVATSGSYSDLSNKPTIPSKTSDLTNDSGFVESTDLATVATTGDYDDLTNKPFIPPGVVVDQSLDSSSTNAVANQAVVGGLNGKSDTGHSHTWTTQSLGSYGTLYVNETLRLVIFYYSRSYNYTSASDTTLETGIIPTAYQPSISIPCSCANPYIAGRVTKDNKLIVTPTKTGTIGTTLQAIWTY